ncbi:MAG TPA: proton-translocating transhydrogenase family protein [Bdellovibrionota bacterium]|nr:proton-translocating transhydrogenase family protein [Bdellovibrionota bacterium]
MSPTMIGIYVFVLSCFVGYHVIWGVTPALHTPLMAVTNAISAIVVVGAILVAGFHPDEGQTGPIELIGFFAVLLASINIFGGFVVTNRILAMFKNKKKSNG